MDGRLNAVLVLEDGRPDCQRDLECLIYDGKTTEWVPKSQVEQNPDGTFTMPEWLAQDKGFI